MITISKAIYSILSSDAVVTGLTGTKIYPLVVPPKTELPVVVYERRSTPDVTKDNSTMYNTNVEIIIMDNDYSNTITIATAIQNALEHYKGTVSGAVIRDIQLYGIDETYEEDAYIQKLSFVVKSV